MGVRKGRRAARVDVRGRCWVVVVAGVCVALSRSGIAGFGNSVARCARGGGPVHRWAGRAHRREPGPRYRPATPIHEDRLVAGLPAAIPPVRHGSRPFHGSAAPVRRVADRMAGTVHQDGIGIRVGILRPPTVAFAGLSALPFAACRSRGAAGTRVRPGASGVRAALMLLSAVRGTRFDKAGCRDRRDAWVTQVRARTRGSR